MIDIEQKKKDYDNLSDKGKKFYADRNIDFLETPTDLNKMVDEHRNELVLNYFEVVRLVDVIDGDDDYYWVFENSFSEKILSSCVGGFFILKDSLSEKDYSELVRVWNLNHIVNKAL